MVISSAARPLAGRGCILERDALDVSSIIVEEWSLRLIVIWINLVVKAFIIADIETAGIDRSLEVVAERHIGTGHLIIEDEADDSQNKVVKQYK